MARKGTKLVTMYINEENEAAWQKVRAHYGNAYSASEVLSHLVKTKYHEINDGQTKRQQAANMQTDIALILSIVSQIAACTEAGKVNQREVAAREKYKIVGYPELARP